MKPGKLTPEELKEIVLSNLPALSSEISCGPGNGLDCAAIKLSEDSQIVISSDPITGAGNDIGSIAIHVSCNDLAAFGVRPKAIMLVILAPVEAEKEQISRIMEQASETAQNLGVEIVGGHTEVSDAVNRFVVSTTAIGINYGKLIQSGGSLAGDAVIMTKTAGLEGTAIFAADYPERLEKLLTQNEIAAAKNMIKQISVVPEGILAGGSDSVHAMHDATEGGILGAAWEMADAAGLGISIYYEKIPIHDITSKISEMFEIDPCRLISSGSLLISTDNPDQILGLLGKNNINATVIGKMTSDGKHKLIKEGKEIFLEPPQQDELYKCINQYL